MVAPRQTFGQLNPWWSPNQTPQPAQPLAPSPYQPQMGPNVAPGPYMGGATGGASTGAGNWTPWGGAPRTAYSQQGPAPSTPSGTSVPYMAGTQPQQNPVGSAGTPGTETTLGTQQPNATPTPMAEFTPATTTGATGGNGSNWSALAAGMLRNGWGLDPQGARQNNGIIVGYGSPYQTTIIMPTDYAYGQDTARWEVAGAGVENAMQRALRKTFDELSGNPQLNSMQVLAKWMRFVDQEARQQGKSSGFNMAQMGGQGMDPNTAGKPTSATAPPGAAPPAAGQPGAGQPGAGNTSAPAAAGGGGRFDPLAIKAASEDQRLGYDMLMTYLTGSNKSGTGPFAGFLEDFFAPVATSMINAMAANNGQMPTNIDDLFASIRSGVGPNATTNLYDTMSNAARSAMQKTLGGGDVSFDELQAAAGTYSPLMTRMLNPIQARMYQRQLGDQLRGMQQASYTDMLGQNNRNYGGEFLGGDFYRNWWDR